MLEILKIRVSDTRIGMYTAIFGQCNILGELALLRCRCYKRVIHWLIGSWFFIFKWRYIFGVYPIFWPKFLIIVGFRSEVSCPWIPINVHQISMKSHDINWLRFLPYHPPGLFRPNVRVAEPGLKTWKPCAKSHARRSHQSGFRSKRTPYQRLL